MHSRWGRGEVSEGRVQKRRDPPVWKMKEALEMAQRLKASAALATGRTLVPCIQIWQLATTCNCSAGGSDATICLAFAGSCYVHSHT